MTNSKIPEGFIYPIRHIDCNNIIYYSNRLYCSHEAPIATSTVDLEGNSVNPFLPPYCPACNIEISVGYLFMDEYLD